MESYDFTPAANFQRKSFHWINSQSKGDDYKKENHFGRRVYSRSRHQIPKSNIQSWIENVEKSVFSDGTVGKVLCAERQLPSQPTFSRKSLAQMTLDQLRHHDEAQQEAEELLNDWVQKKLYEPNILNDKLDEFLDRANGIKSPRRQSPEFSLSVDFDEDAAVDDVIQKMLQKKVVPVKVRGDLGLDSKAKEVDPRVKMELRRKQVRENRLRREREADKRRQEIQLKKEARLKAHQKVMEEEKIKEIKRRQEEYEIQKEMALIRKQMKEEKKRMEEKRKREQHLAEKASEESRSEIQREKWAEVKETVEACRQKEEQRRQQEAKMEMLKMRQKTLELQTLHRHFSSWYGLVLQQRLRVGKACALADWKLLMRCWNTWRSITSRNQINKELQIHHEDLKDNQRKDKKASLHYSGHLLQKYFLAWELFVYGEKERRQLEESKRATKKKMQDLLDAALSRKLPPPENTVEKAPDKQEDILNSTRCEKSPTNANSINGLKPDVMPTEHWKIRKSVVHVKPSRMAAMFLADYPTAKNSQKSSSRSVSVTPVAMNTIERQLQSQKMLVKDQQKQLKEQRKMIEQLQSDHRRQQLKEQLKRQQEVYSCRLPHSEVIHPNPEKTEKDWPHHHSQPFKKRHSISETNSSPSSPKRNKRKTCDQQTTFVLRRSQSVDFIHTKDQRILKNMEARAAERKRLKEEREIRKQQKEDEKLAFMKAAEEQRLKEEEEERKERIKTRQEQKRLEKQREAERQQKLSEMQKQNEKADDFRKYLLLKYQGILPWKQFVAINRDNHIRAVEHHTSTLLRKYMTAWSLYVQETNKSRNEMADTKYKQLIVVRLFNGWKNYKNYTTILEEKADRFYLSNLCVKFFKAWLSYSSEQTMASWEKEEIAEKHYTRQLQRRMFCIWRTFPEMKKKELERQQRKEKMRQKVSMLLPDFE